ncbi:hypothetical protein [Deinococcus misasensis]|nr:hypothetical protein [Deinococcus misasensis]
MNESSLILLLINLLVWWGVWGLVRQTRATVHPQDSGQDRP